MTNGSDDVQQLRDTCRLFSAINQTVELSDLLDILGAEIERLGLFDAYLINLVDNTQTNLVCEKIRLPTGYQNIESTYLKYKFSLEGDFVTARSYLDNRAIQLNRESVQDYEAHVRNRFDRWRIHELITIPLTNKHNKEPLGVIMAFRQQRDLDPSSEEALRKISTPFWYRLHSAMRYDELKSRQAKVDHVAAEQERFLEFVTTVNNLTSPDAIYEAISLEFMRQLPFEHASVMMRERNKVVCKRNTVPSEAHRRFCREWDDYLTANPYELDISDGATPTALLNNTHLLFPDVMKIRHLPMSEKDKNGLATLKTPRTFLFMPIRHKGEAIGLIWLISVTRTIAVSDSDLALIERLCNFIGTAIKNAELYALVADQKGEIESLNVSLKGKVGELADLASKDELTGLHNFRYFELALARKTDEARNATDAMLAIAILDLDHFKQFNDEHGHSAGNTVLSNVGELIQSLTRQHDIPCRYGGEEFVIILPGCDREGAHTFVERLRERIENTRHITDTGEVSVTASIGYATYNSPESAHDFFKRADQALYRAKGLGRNRSDLAKS